MIILLTIFFLLLVVYSFFSYGFVDPNLVISTNKWYWDFQNFSWNLFINNNILSSYLYFLIIVGLFILYFYILRNLSNVSVNEITVLETTKLMLKKYKHFLIFGLLIFPLLLSYNALSHDIFNYLFNAKMVVLYGADPHTQVALDFPQDLWTRFMHNTHTPAPYGRGWTVLSLVPYMFGLGKFSLSLLSFKVWSLISIVLLYFSLQHFSQSLRNRNLNLFELGLIFLNPLLLIEVLSNYHNDLWMMMFAVFGLSFLLRPISRRITDNKVKAKYLIVSIILLLFSISIKLATLVLVPIWIYFIGIYFFSKFFTSKIVSKVKLAIPAKFLDKILLGIMSKLVVFVPDIVGILMFVPLLTSRSQQFLPWYILWVLVWTPFMKTKLLRNLIIIFTFSSSLRYLPWLFNNLEYSNLVIRNQKLITWVIPLVYLFTNLRKKIKIKN